MANKKYVFFYAFINLLSFLPYVLFMLYGANISWYPMLFFYIMMYTANFWINLFNFEVLSSILAMRICLTLSILGSLLVFAGVIPIVGAMMIGICVNYSGFLSSQVRASFQVKVSKKLELTQVLLTLALTAGISVLLFSVPINWNFLVFGIGSVLALFSLPSLSKDSKIQISQPKLTSIAISKATLLLVATSTIFTLKLARSTTLGFNTGVLLVIVALGVIVSLLEIKGLKAKYHKSNERLALSYNFIQGALNTLCMLYVSFATIIFSNSGNILFTLTLPIILAVVTALIFSNQLVRLSPRILLTLNIIGLLLTVSPLLISLGTYIAFTSNALLIGSVYCKYGSVLSKEITFSKSTPHYFSKFGSLTAQVWLVLGFMLASGQHERIFDLMKALGRGQAIRLLPYLGLGLLISVLALTLEFSYFKSQKK